MPLMHLNTLTSTLHRCLPNQATCRPWKRATNSTAESFTIERPHCLQLQRAARWDAVLSMALVARTQHLTMLMAMDAMALTEVDTRQPHHNDTGQFPENACRRGREGLMVCLLDRLLQSITTAVDTETETDLLVAEVERPVAEVIWTIILAAAGTILTPTFPATHQNVQTGMNKITAGGIEESRVERAVDRQWDHEWGIGESETTETAGRAVVLTVWTPFGGVLPNREQDYMKTWSRIRTILMDINDALGYPTGPKICTRIRSLMAIRMGIIAEDDTTVAFTLRAVMEETHGYFRHYRSRIWTDTTR